MSNANTFSKKIKDLTQSDIQYTEDFFRSAFGDGNTELKQTAKAGHRDISHSLEAQDNDIDDSWLADAESFDGQLAVDVFDNGNELVIMSTVAGVRKEDLDIDMNGDMITIRGMRRHKYDNVASDNYFIKECFWGAFSRSIILPADIQHDQIRASLENGVLTIRLPKSAKPRNGRIEIQ